MAQIKQQVDWAYDGKHSTNVASPIVSEYFTRMMLSKIGYRFNPSEIGDLEIQAFNLIANRISERQERDSKRK